MELWIDKIRITLCFMFLLLEGWQDKKRKKILLLPVFIVASAGIVLCFMQSPKDVVYAVIGAIPGAVVLLLAYATGEKIGYGDGFVLMASGVLLGLRMNLLMLLFGLFLAAINSVWILIRKKGNRKTQIPFVPFLLPGLTLSIALTVQGN
ncbi:MAG: prepilin peptidase [Lachnospiraceae bacterium]|nr:prepilin peptidase [Lachnospiraceae bacterium]